MKRTTFINQGREKNLEGCFIRTRTRVSGYVRNTPHDNPEKILIKPKTLLILISYFIDPRYYSDYITVFYKNKVIEIYLNGRHLNEAAHVFDFSPEV